MVANEQLKSVVCSLGISDVICFPEIGTADGDDFAVCMNAIGECLDTA